MPVPSSWLLGRRLALLLLASAAAISSCGKGGDVTGPPDPPAVATVEITPSPVSLSVAQSVQLTAIVKAADGSVLGDRTVTWATSDPAIAGVGESGMVTAAALGEATITATSEGQSGSTSVSVTAGSVASVEVVPNPSSVLLGQTAQLTAVVRSESGEELSGRVVTWSSSDEAVATLSEAGVVRGEAVGEATITATSEGRSGSTALTVSAVPVATVEVTPSSAEIAVDERVQLTATAKDAAGSVLPGRPAGWTTSDANVARVNPTGRVTGIGAGSATITATIEGKTASATITVTQQAVATVEVTPNPATVAVQQTIQLTATLKAADGTELGGRPVTWETIAKLLESEASAADRTDLTAGGGTPLTPEYAAPEQVSGGPVTTATDVYSLGVLLYQLLAGRHPTSGSSSLSTAGYLSGILDTEPPRLSTAVTGEEAAAARASSVDRLRRFYRGDLDNILAKALKKDPTQRYPTVTAFAEDLDRYLRHEPVLARSDSFGYRARKFVRRNRGGVIAAGLTAAALVTATVVTTGQMIEARRQRDEARVQRDRARYEEQRATASSGFMETLLHTIAPARRSYTTTDLLDHAREILETKYQADPRFVARMMIDLSDHYAWLNNATAEVALLARAAQLARQAGDLETAGRAQCGIGLLQAQWGEVDSARTSIARVEELLSRAPGPATWGKMWCLVARAVLAGETGQHDSALSLVWQAVALARAAGDTTSVEYADVLETVSAEHWRASRVREALELCRQNIALLDRIGRGSSLPMLAARQSEAGFLRDLGEMRSADSALTEVLPLARRMDPRYVPWYIRILAGELAITLDRPDSAIAIFRRAWPTQDAPPPPISGGRSCT